MAIDINRGTAGVVLPSAMSTEILGATVESSAVMKLAQKVTLPGSGITIPVVTGDATAEWVNETNEVPVSEATVGTKSMTPYKLGVTELFSVEFKRDLPGLYAELVRRLPGALGAKFDATVFGNTAPGSNFDTLGGAPSVGINGNTYGGLVAADQAIAAAGGTLTGYVLASQGRGVLLNAVDTMGRPLFINNVVTDGAVPALLGAPVLYSRGVFKAGTPNVLGFAGDWTAARYGTVEGIKVAVSDQATVNKDGEQINLWQREMFAVKATVELGFITTSTNRFVKLTDAAQA